jgi:hypothetical protein
MDGGVILGLLVALLALWAALIVVLWLVRPHNIRLMELVRVVPDVSDLSEVCSGNRSPLWAEGGTGCRTTALVSV